MAREDDHPPAGGRTPVDLPTLQRWLDACDPRAPIENPWKDPHYFNLDQVEVDGERVALRGDDHIERLYEAVTRSGEQSCQLFSGFSGTGKSTELRRLTGLLNDDGYSVVMVDVEDYHDLNHELDIGDFLILLAAAFGEAVSKRLGKEVLKENYWKRLHDFFAQDVELKEIKLPAGVVDLKVGLRHQEPFWLKARNALRGSLGKLRDHSHSYIEKCVTSLKEADDPSRGVVFILDSLERLTSPTDFRAVTESAIRVFTHYSAFLHLPGCHVIYAIPPYVQLISPGLKDRYDRASLVLPAIKVLERGEILKPYSPGVDALIELLDKRIPVEKIFGPNREILQKLVVYSGGHVRTLITFIREILFRLKHLPVSEEEVERVAQPFRENAGVAIWRESVPLLERILRQGTIEGIREEEYPFLARFMDNYVVLCYRNGEGWYEVHPLARDIVRRLADEQKAEEKSEK